MKPKWMIHIDDRVSEVEPFLGFLPWTEAVDDPSWPRQKIGMGRSKLISRHEGSNPAAIGFYRRENRAGDEQRSTVGTR